jgi:hypothetical protein
MSDRTTYVFVADRINLIANGAVELGIGAKKLTFNVVDIGHILPERDVWVCNTYLRPPEWVDYLVESRS